MSRSFHPFRYSLLIVAVALLLSPLSLLAQEKQAKAPKKAPETWPPVLPGGKTIVTINSADLLSPPSNLKEGVEIAKTAPTVDFLYYPGQNYKGNPWSVWGDSVVGPDGKYYSAIGDHGSPDSKECRPGHAFVFEYDPAAKSLRAVSDITKTLNMPEGHYVPGKVHSKLDFGADGKLYWATHRGSGGSTTDQYHYQGDWVMSYDPKTGKTDVLIQGPVPKHAIPASILDPQRLIFYGGTINGKDAKDPGATWFFAYDIKNNKVLYKGPNGCYRYFLMATSTGKVYYEKTDDKGAGTGELMGYDPASGQPPKSIGPCPGLRAASSETADGKIYAVSSGQNGVAKLWAFDTKTEKITTLGDPAVASNHYITTLDVDPTGRYLYCIPGAHGGSEKDNSAVIQYDLKTNKKKVVAFLHPAVTSQTGFTPMGTFGSALDAKGETLYITWHGGRDGGPWTTCALTVLHLPASERP